MTRAEIDGSLHTESPRVKAYRTGRNWSNNGGRRHRSVSLVSAIDALEGGKTTLAIRARINDRTRNLNLSSSDCMIIRRKLVLGSMFPVCSSTSSILLATTVASAATSE